MPSNRQILLLPGLHSDATLFQGQIPFLAPLADIIVGDLSRADSIAGMAADALAEVPSGQVVLIGLSMGGYVALEIMRQAPERVSGLALLDTSARPDTPEAIANREKLIALAEKDLDAVVDALLPRLSHPDHMNLPMVRGVVQSMAVSLGKDVFIRQQRAIMRRADSRPTLPQIACPTLVLCGRDDLITPLEVHEELVAGIPGALLVVIDECGHLSTLDQPEKVGEALKSWLTSEFA